MKLVKNFRERNGWFNELGGPLPIGHQFGNEGGRGSRHKHNHTHEYIVVLQGTAVLEVNEEIITLQPGNIMMVEPGDVHLMTEHSQDFSVLLFADWQTGGKDVIEV